MEPNNMYNNDLFDDMYNDNISLNMFLTRIFENIAREGVNDLFTSIIEEQILEDVLEESLQGHSTLEKTDIIINIEKKKYKEFTEKQKDNNTECSVCITKFEDEDDVSVTSCGHIFHNGCIVEWGKYKQECPNCRKKIKY